MPCIFVYKLLCKVMGHTLDATLQAFSASFASWLYEALDFVLLAFRACERCQLISSLSLSVDRYVQARVSCAFEAAC